MRARLLLCVFVLASLSTEEAALYEQRDLTAATVAGSGEIGGVVISEDVPPHPIRRAVVTLAGDAAPARSVVTDDDGRFAFVRLPAGRFSISAKKAAHLPAAYGATRPGRAGTPISLGRDEHTSVTMTMARGAVVMGIITDRNGQPLTGVPVSALDARATGRTDNLFATAEFVITDDRGQYRIYGLMPGEYILTATPRVTGAGETGAPTMAQIDAVFAELSRRDGHPVAAPGGVAPSRGYAPIPTPQSVGFAPTYFPGTSLFRDAARVKLAAAEERAGLDFLVSPVRVSTVTGTISGGVQNFATVQLSLIIDGPRLPPQIGGTPILTRRPDDQGRFAYSNMAPGRYRITARANRTQTASPPVNTPVTVGGGGGSSSSTGGGWGPGAGGDYVFAVADVDVFGDDVAGVTLALQPGSTFSGRIVFDAGTSPVPADLAKLQVSVSPPGGTSSSMSNGTTLGNSFSSVRPAQVKADGAFAIAGIGPGVYLLRCVLPPELTRTWWLRSAMVGGRDVLDAPLEFEPGVNLSNATLTLTDKHSELSGTLQTGTGVPAPEYFVIAFPADRTRWRAESRRMVSTRPANDGRFVLTDLPGGEYVLAALGDVDGDDWQKPEVLERLAAAGVKVTVRDGATTRQDLRMTQ